MKKIAISALVVGSFSAGYKLAPQQVINGFQPINPSSLRQHEDDRRALEACHERDARRVQVGSEKISSKAPASK